jgi:hypothetical protein
MISSPLFRNTSPKLAVNVWSRSRIRKRNDSGRSANVLQQQYLAVQAKLDRAYEDRLAGRITDQLWGRKSAEWEAELAAVRRETARHEKASHDYGATGSKILELAKTPIICSFDRIRANKRDCWNAGIELHVRQGKSFTLRYRDAEFTRSAFGSAEARAPSDVLQLDLFREAQVFENQHFVLTVARSHKSTLQVTIKMKQAILTPRTRPLRKTS